MPLEPERKPGQSIDDRSLMFGFAHDVRTYLRTVLTRIQLVQRGGDARLSEENQSMLREAATAVGDIHTLLEQMVAYSDVSDRYEAMDLSLLLQGTLLERKIALTEAGAKVDVTNDLHLAVPVGLQGILRELLTNACRFRDTDRPLRISITTRLAASTLEIAVTDNGLGVAPQYLEKIFDPFQRLHSRDEFPGHGLGLAICRRVAAVWAGTVTAMGRPEGGLIVRVTVPDTECHAL